VVFLDRGILPHQRSGGLAHRSKSLYQRGMVPQVRSGRGMVLHCGVSEAKLHWPKLSISNAASVAIG
jgi:hypothetical protein